MNSITQRRAALKELQQVALQCLEEGLALLQVEDPLDFRMFASFRLLATGFERYLKLILHSVEYDQTGSFLSKEELKGIGHGIRDLHDEVTDTLQNSSAASKPWIRQELEAIDQDCLFQDFLGLLSDFAMTDRYAFMDRVAGDDGGKTFEQRWDNILDEHWECSAYQDFVRRVVAALERALRCYTAVVFHAIDDDEVTSAMSPMLQFMHLLDEELGKTEYPPEFSAAI